MLTKEKIFQLAEAASNYSSFVLADQLQELGFENKVILGYLRDLISENNLSYYLNNYKLDLSGIDDKKIIKKETTLFIKRNKSFIYIDNKTLFSNYLYDSQDSTGSSIYFHYEIGYKNNLFFIKFYENYKISSSFEFSSFSPFVKKLFSMIVTNDDEISIRLMNYFFDHLLILKICNS